MKQGGFLAPVVLVAILGAWCLFLGKPLKPPVQGLGWQVAEEPWSPVTGFTKVDPYPLYVATYTADYRLSKYLETGSYSPSMIQGEPSCTCFYAAGSGVYGRNFDFPPNPVLLLFTYPEDGYASVSLVDLGYFGYSMSELPDAEDLESLTTTPYLPFDGMNEAGLVVGMAAIPHAEPPFSPNKVTIGEIQVIRLLLDRAVTVDEALALLDNYNVQMVEPPIHYLVADATGASAIIEYVGGERRVVNGSSFNVMTNFLVTETDMTGGAPCWRYSLVAEGLTEAQGMVSPDEAMALLRGASQDHTIWSVVYSQATGEARVAVGRGYGHVLVFKLGSAETG
ncbi:MAG TPA: linear amide C-N hydrolase [Candidatus Bathyarchaeia archaeon]